MIKVQGTSIELAGYTQADVANRILGGKVKLSDTELDKRSRFLRDIKAKLQAPKPVVVPQEKVESAALTAKDILCMSMAERQGLAA